VLTMSESLTPEASYWIRNVRAFYSNFMSLVPIHKKGNEIDCSNYRGTSLLSTSYKILSSILLSRLSPYIDEIIGDHQSGFRRNVK
jgi:hypothetical protein